MSTGAPSLEALGLAPGHPVRFRRKPAARWSTGRAERVEKDGSIGVRDGKGAWRAIPVERIEVRTTGARGAVVWEALAEVAARAEQLKLL